MRRLFGDLMMTLETEEDTRPLAEVTLIELFNRKVLWIQT